VYLSLGLSVVLVFVGAKFIWSDLFGKVPIWVSLAVHRDGCVYLHSRFVVEDPRSGKLVCDQLDQSRPSVDEIASIQRIAD
jgi:hypothetical protein